MNLASAALHSLFSAFGRSDQGQAARETDLLTERTEWASHGLAAYISTSLSEFLSLGPAAANLKIISQCCCPGLWASNLWQQQRWTTPQPCSPFALTIPSILELCTPQNGVLGTHFATSLQGRWMIRVESLVSLGDPGWDRHRIPLHLLHTLPSGPSN